MKKASITAAILLIFGILLGIGGLSIMGFDFSKLLSANYTTRTYTKDGTFTDISITGITCDIRIAKSNNDTCKIVCTMDDRLEPTVKVDNGKLQVHINDLRKWYQHIGFNWCNNMVTVYLPESTYNSLEAGTTTGDIKTESGFYFTNVSLKTTTGDIEVEGNTSFTNVMLNTTTGDIRVSGLFCKDFSATVSTGDMKLQDVLGVRLKLKGTTGGIVLTRCDGSEIDISLSTGDVKGTLRTGKQFTANATTGTVRVPTDSGSDTCQITTTTGDIDITVG